MDGEPVTGFKQFGQRGGLLRLAVDKKHLTQALGDRFNPLQQLGLIGVAAQLVEA